MTRRRWCHACRPWAIPQDFGPAPRRRARFQNLPLDDPGQRERFGRGIARAGAARGADEAAFGARHGDRTPWTMTRLGDRVRLRDWDRHDPEAPFGLELARRRIRANTRGRSPAGAPPAPGRGTVCR